MLFTAEQNILKKNDLKARSILMMTLPSEHLLTFNKHKDAKSLFEAIEARFGGNEATKKTQKTLLKIDTACLSDATVYAYLATQPNGSQVVHEDLEQIHEDDNDEMDLKWQLALLSMKARKFYQRTGKKIIINGSDTAGYDKKKIAIKKGLASVEEQLVIYKKNESMLYDQISVLKRDAPFNESDINALKKQKGLGYNDVPPPLTGLFAPPSVDLSTHKKTSDAPIIEDWVSDCDEDETVVLESLNVQKPKQADQPRKVSKRTLEQHTR
ncbi:hypothetical protein Tco_1392857 [Tanacetum coccineum]